MKGLRRSLVLALALTLTGANFVLAKPADSTDAEGASGRAGFWRKGVQGSPSIKQAEKAVAANPKDAIANNDLGWAYRQAGDLDKAEKHLKAAISIKEDLAQAHSNLSVVYFDRKQTAEALTQARRAVALDPKNAVFLLVLGNALDQNGDRLDAIESYKAALKLRPDYENALYHLGRVLSEDGNKSEASLILSEALKLDPDDERVMKLLDPLVADGATAGGVPAAAKKSSTK
jgi:tetratricopeptide (TPR) repeat protein